MDTRVIEEFGGSTVAILGAAGGLGRFLYNRFKNDLAGMDAPQIMLKAIIEAQVYDDTVAVHAINSECRYLAEQAPGKWDAEWFSRLRMTVGVLRDAHAGRSNLISNSVALPTSSDFLMRLMAKYDAKELLLETLARQDAEAAISIASETARRDLMDHVASASDDFAVMQGIISKCEAGNGAWRAALCERALLDKNVARVLSSVDAGASDARRPNAWQRSGLLGVSAYGSLLDDFLRERRYWSQRMIDFLEMMAKIEVPSRRVLAMPRPKFPFAGILAAGIGITLWFFVATSAGAPSGVATSHHSAPVGFLTHYHNQLLGLIAAIVPAVTFLVYGVLRSRAPTGEVTILKSTLVTITIDGSRIVELSPEKTLPAGETYTIRNRSNILREILNVSSYAWTSSHQVEPDKLLEMQPAHPLSDAIFNGIPPRESRCLLVARSLRRNSSVSSTQDPSDLKPATPAQ